MGFLLKKRDEILANYIGIVINHYEIYKDPHSPTRISWNECQPGGVLMTAHLNTRKLGPRFELSKRETHGGDFSSSVFKALNTLIVVKQKRVVEMVSFYLNVKMHVILS